MFPRPTVTLPKVYPNYVQLHTQLDCLQSTVTLARRRFRFPLRGNPKGPCSESRQEDGPFRHVHPVRVVWTRRQKEGRRPPTTTTPSGGLLQCCRYYCGSACRPSCNVQNLLSWHLGQDPAGLISSRGRMWIPRHGKRKKVVAPDLEVIHLLGMMMANFVPLAHLGKRHCCWIHEFILYTEARKDKGKCCGQTNSHVALEKRYSAEGEELQLISIVDIIILIFLYSSCFCCSFILGTHGLFFFLGLFVLRNSEPKIHTTRPLAYANPYAGSE